MTTDEAVPQKAVQAYHLVISLLGMHNPQALFASMELIQQCECRVIESKLSVLGTLFVGHIMIMGKWNQLAKAENLLANLAKELDLHITWQRTHVLPCNPTTVSYSVYITACDDTEILSKVTDFFMQQQIEINTLTSYTYLSRHTQSPMVFINIQIIMPVAAAVANLRDQFMLLCDDLNLDGVIELDK